MAVLQLIERHEEWIQGILSCFDRVICMGTLPEICHPEAMTRFLNTRGIRIFDFTNWARELAEAIRKDVEALADKAGIQVEYIARKGLRKEDRIKEILAQRGQAPGIVHIFSGLEACSSFRPWYHRPTGKSFLKGRSGKCLHYYIYFIDSAWGLCYLRIPTWAPFRAQFYCNGHNRLSTALTRAGISHRLLDNLIVDVADYEAAQQLSDGLKVEELHRLLEACVQRFFPSLGIFSSLYHWSIMQCEYATDVIFKRREELAPLYEALVRGAVLVVKAEDVATFLGRELAKDKRHTIGSDFRTEVRGSRVRHFFGPAAIKMYDKRGIALRVETSTNDVSFFRHHRRVEHIDGSWEMKVAQVKKTIYSLPAIAQILLAANRRYLDFLATLEDPSEGHKHLDRLSKTVRENGRTHRGFNFFRQEDLRLILTLVRGEFLIHGFSNRVLRRFLDWTPGQISRSLRRLRLHGVIRKIGRTYRYHLTVLGRITLIAGLKLREFLVLPALNENPGRFATDPV
jgi:hypothetical protein